MSNPISNALAQADAILDQDRRLAVRTNPAAQALVEFLNSDAPFFYFGGKSYTTAEVNAITASAVEHGDIIEIPGDPYTWKLA